MYTDKLVPMSQTIKNNRVGNFDPSPNYAAGYTLLWKESALERDESKFPILILHR